MSEDCPSDSLHHAGRNHIHPGFCRIRQDHISDLHRRLHPD